MAGFNNVTDFYPQITGQLTVYPGPINQVTATVDNNVGTPRVEVTQTPTDQGMNILFAFFNLKGEQGETGNGIQSIAKTATVGLVDTYTITYTDGTTSTFNVTNGAKGDTGNGIQSIAKTGTSGLVDTYTITFTNGQTTTFTVTNGAKGDTGETGNGIASIAKTSTSGLVDTYTITFTDGTTTTFDVTNGEDGTVTTDQLMEAIANQLPTDNASGSIASFPDGADDIPVKSLIAQIAPLQDLHGQSAPYPAGGGANKFDKSTVLSGQKLNNDGTTVESTGYFTSDYIPVSANSDYYLTNVASSSVGYSCAVYDSSKSFLRIKNLYDATNTASGTINVGADAAYVRIDSVSANLDTCMLSLGTTAPSGYAPYSNICPIEGWTGAKITRTGINIWDEEWEEGTIDGDGNKASATDRIRSKYYIPAKAESTYYFHVTNPTYYATTMQVGICFYDNNKTYISTTGTAVNRTFTTPANTYYLKFYTGGSGRTSHPVYQNDFSINYPSTDTSYHSGTDNKTVNIDWTDEAGTVFKGNINVTTGVLTVTALELTMSKDDVWGYSSSTLTFYKNLSGDFVRKNYDQAFTGLCDTFPPYDGVSAISSGNFVMFYTTNAQGVRFSMPSANGDLPTFKEAIDGVKVIYPIVTPITYQLTPTEVKTLLGDNSIWADCGDVDVTYRADIAKYIAKQLAAVQALILENQ